MHSAVLGWLLKILLGALNVASDLRLKRIQPLKALLLAQKMEKADLDLLPVKVALKIKNKGFAIYVTALVDRRAHADV